MAENTQIIQSTQISRGKDFVVRSEIPVAEFDAYFEEMGRNCRSPEPLKYHAILINKGSYISLEADLTGDLSYDCDACGETFVRALDQHVSLKLIEASHVTQSEEIELSADDLDVETYSGTKIDLHHILLSSIYLEMDEPCLCREDCKGICSNCGKNLNEGPCSCSFE